MQQPKSISGPLFLIAAGVIWLLVKAGNIPTSNLWALTYVWPYLLIAAGIGIILKPYWQYISVVLDILTIGGVVLSIVYAPQLGWAAPPVDFVIHGDTVIGPGEPGSGNVISQTREVSGFDSIELDYPAQVFISQGKAESVKVEAEDNLMPRLKTEVRNDTLHIFYEKVGDKHVNPTEPIKITIVVKDLKQVEFNSAGELTVEGIETDDLKISVNGAGRLDLVKIAVKNLEVDLSGAGGMAASGTTDDLNVSISGFGSFDGDELHSQTANISLSGAGSATVWVDDELDAEISGAGSVHYYGSPNVTKQIGGLGSVDRLGDK